MTEVEWLEGGHPLDMLAYLERRVSDRKLRLFACACCRDEELWQLLAIINGCEVVENVERFAEGSFTWEGVIALNGHIRTRTPHLSGHSSNPRRMNRSVQAARTLNALRQKEAWTAAWETARESLTLLGPVQRVHLYEFFGNPFRLPMIDLAWRSWNDRCIEHIAQAIYDERAFDRLPILADALQDAGCDNADILAHCRSGGEHVRGCWVVDLLLSKK